MSHTCSGNCGACQIEQATLWFWLLWLGSLQPQEVLGVAKALIIGERDNG